MSKCQISQKNLNKILEDLSYYCTLENLSISETFLDEVTSLHLSKMIKRFKVVDLDLSLNELSLNTLFPIINALQVNNSLQHLNLSHLSIGTKGKIQTLSINFK